MMRSFSPIRNHDGASFHSGGSPDGSVSASWVAGRCVAERKIIATPDVLREPRVEMASALRERLARYRIGAVVSVPLLTHAHVVGALSLSDATGRELTADELQTLQVFADQAALALDNARLYRSAQDSLVRLRETQAQLVQAAKMSAVGQLVSGVAHELNNPLSVIIGYGQLLLGRDAPPPLRRPVELMVAQGERMSKIVRNLLYFARQRPPERAAVDLLHVGDRRQPPACRVSVVRIRKEELEAVEPARPRRRPRSPDARPGVQADVMVVAAGRREQRSGVPPHGHVETQRVDPEGLGHREVGDLQVHVAEHGALGHLRLVRIPSGLGEQALEVERQRRHLELAARVGPLLARAVAVQLDPVPLRVGEVQRLADEVVGRAAQVPAGLEDAPERACEVYPPGNEQGEMEEARRAWRPRRRLGVGDQLDQRPVAGAEGGDPVVGREGAQPDRALVEVAQETDVADAEADRAEPGPGRQLTHRRRQRDRAAARTS